MESKRVYIRSEFAEKVFAAVLAAMMILTVVGGAFGSLLAVLGIIGILVMILAVVLIFGSCHTDDSGFVVNMPFQGSTIIPYGNITDAYITLAMGAKPSNYSEKRELIHTLHIVTKGGEYSYKLKSPSGYIDSPMAFAMELPRAAALAQSPFAEIVSIVRERSGCGSVNDHLYW
jgi:hypothetical protein